MYRRVPIECFFGRMEKLWKITSSVYRFSHEYFDIDYDNCVLLTNEHIREHQLVDADAEYYRFIINSRQEKRTRQVHKRQAELQRYREKKRRLAERYSNSSPEE